MADHSKPTTTSTYVNFVSELDGRLDDISLGLDPATTSPTNLATNSIRWTSASNKWQKYNGTTWNDLSSAYSININGTVGATTPASGAFTTLSATGNVTLGDASGDTVTINGTVGAGVVISGSTATDALRITQTGAGNALVVEDSTNPDSSPFVVDTSGNVIVGNSTTNVITGLSTPQFQVQGITTGAAGLSVHASDTTSSGGWQSAKSRGTLSAPTIVNSGDNLGQIRFAGYDGSGFIRAAEINGQSDGTPGTNDMPGRLIFSTTADGASSVTERMRIDSSGNVGIGTSSPTYKLDVSGSTNPVAIRLFNSTAASGLIFTQDTSNNSFVLNQGNGYLGFGTNNSERMRIRDDGNVAIGGAGSSAASLYLQKNISGATSYGLIQSGQFQSGVTNGYGITSIGNVASGATLTNLAHFRATESTISGTVTYQYGFFSVADIISATSNYGFYAGNTAAVGAGKTAYGFYSNINTATGGGTTYNFYAAGTADNYFAGNVGIGTSSPTFISGLYSGLHINGTSGTSLHITNDTVGTTGSDGLDINYDTSGNASYVNRETSGFQRWYTGGSERMRITSSGGVSFGSSGTAYGTSGQVLTSNGNAPPSWSSVVGITAGTAVASTSGTSISFTNIPSTAKRITIMFTGVSTNGSSDFIVQLGTGATPTYTTSGYLGGCGTQTGGTVTNNSSGFNFNCSTVAAGIWHGTLIITNITGNSWTQFGTIGRSDSAAMRYSAGSVSLAAVLTAVRVTTVGGTDTFDAGTINIFWE